MTLASTTTTESLGEGEGSFPLALRLDSAFDLSDDALFRICANNRDLHIERSAAGELLLMSPAGGLTGDRNAEILRQLTAWARRDGQGRVFDSSTGFTLTNGAMRSPDASWVERSRLRQLSPAQRERFLPLCPALVVELRSPSDALAPLEAKMVEYVANGALLGWLIDPLRRRVDVYRVGCEVEALEDPGTISGDPEFPGLLLEMQEIWEPAW